MAGDAARYITTIAIALSALCSAVAASFNTLPSGVYDVSKYGAKGDGKTKDTDAVRKAFEECGRAGGGTVLFPNLHNSTAEAVDWLARPLSVVRSLNSDGSRDARRYAFWAPDQVPLMRPTVQGSKGSVYLTGAFNISSNTVLQVSPGVTILASTDSEDFPLIQPLPWYGGGSDYQQSGDPIYQPFVHSFLADNIRITGGGTIDGSGEPWWKCWRGDHKSSPCKGVSRPHMINLVSGSNVEIDNVQIHNSPSWTLHFSNITGVHLHDVTVVNPANAPNADGIDLDCSQQVLVENCKLDVGDDIVAIKSGIDWLGRQYGRPSRDILIRNLQGFHGHGLSIGSEMSAGVHNVTFFNITLDGTDRGVRLKSQRGRGGLVSNVTYRMLRMKNVGTGVSMNLNYHKGLKPTNATATPRLDSIILDDVVADDMETAFDLEGLEESHITNIQLHSVKISAKKSVESCQYISGSCSGDTSPCPPCLSKLS